MWHTQSAVVTGLLLALNLPPEVPFWIPVTTSSLYAGKAAMVMRSTKNANRLILNRLLFTSMRS